MLSAEVECYWRTDFGWVKVAFYLSRYVPLFGTIPIQLWCPILMALSRSQFHLWSRSNCYVESFHRSDALGHVFTMIGRDWTHLGVAKLYTDICRNGYKIMYLTSRAIGQADSTRDYLRGIKQNDYQLPEGPVIMSPDRLMASLHRCVICVTLNIAARTKLNAATERL